MNIGIIGSGAAGLVSAWLLEEHHDVTVLERDDRFGGHAQTVAVDLNGKTYYVDTGIHFFSQVLQPAFMRLLVHIQAPYLSYYPSTTFHDETRNWTVAMPPFGSLGRMRGLVNPATLKTLINFRKLITGSIELVEKGGDFQITLEAFVAELGLPEWFRERFVFPYLCSFWGTSRETVRGYSARNVLSYLVLTRPPVVTPLPVCEMKGGMQAYIDLLVSKLSRTTLHKNAGVESITRETDARYTVRTADGGEHRFDQLIMATNAEQASALIAPLAGTEAVREALDLVEYFDSKMAVHGDIARMPPNRAHWSTVNGLFDGTYCSTTDWGESNRDVDLFRSWVQNIPRMPEPLYAEVDYRHPHPDLNYFRQQQLLEPLQGRDGLWFTGMYVTHYDNHEGAVRSAMNVAAALAPSSTRLHVLKEGAHAPEPGER